MLVTLRTTMCIITVCYAKRTYSMGKLFIIANSALVWEIFTQKWTQSILSTSLGGLNPSWYNNRTIMFTLIFYNVSYLASHFTLTIQHKLLRSTKIPLLLN